MPRFGPIKRPDLIRYLRQLGFIGPYVGGQHQFMERGEVRLIIPNPHRGDIGSDLLARLLREGEISRNTWDRL